MGDGSYNASDNTQIQYVTAGILVNKGGQRVNLRVPSFIKRRSRHTRAHVTHTFGRSDGSPNAETPVIEASENPV